MSQFRQRCTSRAVCSAVKPSSTSMFICWKRRVRSTCCIFWRVDGIVVVVIAPLADPHLLADEIHALRQALGDRNALAVIVDGDGGLMAVLDGPDDVLRSPGRVAAEEDAVARALHGLLVHHGHVPLVELDADVALDPGERVFLADGEDHIVGGEENRVDAFSISWPRRPIPGARTPCR